MSTSKSGSRGGNPVRALAAVFALILAGLVTMVGIGTTTPKLAIDLAGGTSVTLTAKPLPGTTGSVTNDALDQAVEIIRQRVNGFGVSEALVTTLGSDNIVVSVPGQSSNRIVEQVGQTALLRFRPVLLAGPPTPGAALPDLSELIDLPDSLGDVDPSGAPGPEPTVQAPVVGPPAATGSPESSNRAVSSALRAGEEPSPSPSAGRSPAAEDDEAENPSASPSPGAEDEDEDPQVGGIPKAVQDEYAETNCLDPAARDGGDQALPSAVVVACEVDGSIKYILGPSRVQGTDVNSVEAGLPQGASTGSWEVNLGFNGEGTAGFRNLTGDVAGLPPPTNQIAIALDGVVYSAPGVDSAIPDGQARIFGNFTAETAKDLEKVLKFGALPLAFEKSTVSTISATLGDDQLRGGLIAGGIGVVLVVLYCILFYRALGVVALVGLVVAAAMSYMMVTLLGEGINYRLSIAGIAGLIVAIGITADSFVVFFERVRDEIRDGRSPRSAVEYGWIRARRTILSANFVSILAAAVLYFFSVAEVKGFAFTLGVATALDIVVIFLFTKPLTALLMRRPFFARGHKWSGVNPENLGVKRKTRPPAGARVVGTKEA